MLIPPLEASTIILIATSQHFCERPYTCTQPSSRMLPIAPVSLSTHFILLPPGPITLPMVSFGTLVLAWQDVLFCSVSGSLLSGLIASMRSNKGSASLSAAWTAAMTVSRDSSEDRTPLRQARVRPPLAPATLTLPSIMSSSMQRVSTRLCTTASLPLCVFKMPTVDPATWHVIGTPPSASATDEDATADIDWAPSPETTCVSAFTTYGNSFGPGNTGNSACSIRALQSMSPRIKSNSIALK
mmetsp:Transcript_966/g.2239  ORF Transcript_966/g.2239 Transcript_966/m.2239 type:complete len:242 (-) Transcript_966:170-895(-)